MWNLPIYWIAIEVGKKIGGLFSFVREVIVLTKESKEERHIKIQVKVDLSKPFLRETTIRLDRTLKWIVFKYEKCPDFCYYYGRLGHNEKNCNLKGINLEKNT